MFLVLVTMEEQYPEGEVNPGILVYTTCTSKSMYYIKPKVNNFSCHFDFLKIAHRQFGNSYLTSATFNHSKVTLREEAGQK